MVAASKERGVLSSEILNTTFPRILESTARTSQLEHFPCTPAVCRSINASRIQQMTNLSSSKLRNMASSIALNNPTPLLINGQMSPQEQANYNTAFRRYAGHSPLDLLKELEKDAVRLLEDQRLAQSIFNLKDRIKNKKPRDWDPSIREALMAMAKTIGCDPPTQKAYRAAMVHALREALDREFRTYYNYLTGMDMMHSVIKIKVDRALGCDEKEAAEEQLQERLESDSKEQAKRTSDHPESDEDELITSSWADFEHARQRKAGIEQERVRFGPPRRPRRRGQSESAVQRRPDRMSLAAPPPSENTSQLGPTSSTEAQPQQQPQMPPSTTGSSSSNPITIDTSPSHQTVIDQAMSTASSNDIPPTLTTSGRKRGREDSDVITENKQDTNPEEGDGNEQRQRKKLRKTPDNQTSQVTDADSPPSTSTAVDSNATTNSNSTWSFLSTPDRVEMPPDFIPRTPTETKPPVPGFQAPPTSGKRSRGSEDDKRHKDDDSSCDDEHKGKRTRTSESK